MTGKKLTEAKKQQIADAKKSLEIQSAESEANSVGLELTPKELAEIKDVADNDEHEKELQKAALLAKKQKEILKKAKAKVNQSVPQNILVQRPGYGIISAVAKYHMRESFRFLVGRNKNKKVQIIGLFESSKKIKEVIRGHAAGCPYATWTLIQLDEQIKVVEKSLIEAKEEAAKLIASKSRIVVKPFTSNNPSDIPLNFQANYPFHMANLLMEYDDILRGLKSYELLRIISHEQFIEVESLMGSKFRNLLFIPARWYFIGKESVLAKDAKYLDAEHRMGVIPEEILAGIIKPKYL